MTPTLENYTLGRWRREGRDPQELRDASTGEVIALANTEGFDYAAILDYGRRVGNPALRRLTFHERDRMLKALALYLQEKKEQFYELSYRTGATRADSWVDIEGASATCLRMPRCDANFPTSHFTWRASRWD